MINGFTRIVGNIYIYKISKVDRVKPKFSHDR